MAKFVFAYHGGSMPETEEEGVAVMEAWNAWYGGLGASLADGGAPTGRSMTVAADGSTTEGGGANPVSGYTIVNADDLEGAVALAKGCPILGAGGSVEVAETIEM
jgi:hypothetical protein